MDLEINLHFDISKNIYWHLIVVQWLTFKLGLPDVTVLGELSGKALESGVDSPALRELAAFSESLDEWDKAQYLEGISEELSFPNLSIEEDFLLLATYLCFLVSVEQANPLSTGIYVWKNIDRKFELIGNSEIPKEFGEFVSLGISYSDFLELLAARRESLISLGRLKSTGVDISRRLLKVLRWPNLNSANFSIEYNLRQVLSSIIL